jgi:hypothetical protein
LNLLGIIPLFWNNLLLNRIMLNRIMPNRILAVLCSTTTLLTPLLSIAPALALPPPEDIPEEVLRTEIITEARSPVNGEALTAAEYAELEAQLQRNPELRNSISPQIRNIIFLLQIRRAVRTIAPFLLP